MNDQGTTQNLKLEAFRKRVRQGNDPHGPVRETMSRLGDRWTPLILFILQTDVMRYTKLFKEINSMADAPVSQRILTLKLRACERDGFVQRTVIPTIPPQVEYGLTALGYLMVEELEHLVCWLEDHSKEIHAARLKFDLALSD